MSIRLNEQYFTDKEFKTMSSAGVRDFVRTNPEAERLAWENSRKFKKDGTHNTDFTSMDDEELINCMRKKLYVNNTDLRDELVSRGKVILPIILEKFVRSFNDAFLDHTFVIITSLEYACEAYLLEKFDEIKGAYTQSMVCQILGTIGSEKSIELLDAMYISLNRDYPSENYEQGPLFGMWTLGYRLGHHNVDYNEVEK